jgi:hypothetical protein
MEMDKIVEILEQAGVTVRFTDKVEANFYLMVCEFFSRELVTGKHRYKDIFFINMHQEHLEFENPIQYVNKIFELLQVPSVISSGDNSPLKLEKKYRKENSTGMSIRRIIENMEYNQFEITNFRFNDDRSCYIINASYDNKFCIIGRDRYQEGYHIIMYLHHFFYNNSTDFWGAIFNLFNVKDKPEPVDGPDEEDIRPW